jgi:hypothetical protein
MRVKAKMKRPLASRHGKDYASGVNQEPLPMESREPPAALNVLLWPGVSPKNRVGGSAAFSFVFAFQYIGETLDTPAQNGGCGYDFASGVHKYLYVEDNPVNHIDPTGHDLADIILSINIQVSMAAIRLAPVVTAARYASAAVFVAGLTFDQQFRDNAFALGPDALLSASGELTAVLYDFRGMFFTEQTITIAAPQATKLGDTILKGVDDDMLVHFAPADAVQKINVEGIKNPAGADNYFFKVGQAKNWTPQQVKAAIGGLAGSSKDISAACIVDPSQISKLDQSQMSFWTEYFTQQQGIMPNQIIGILPQ